MSLHRAITFVKHIDILAVVLTHCGQMSFNGICIVATAKIVLCTELIELITSLSTSSFTNHEALYFFVVLIVNAT